MEIKELKRKPGTSDRSPVTGQEHGLGLGQVQFHALSPEGHKSTDKLVV